MWTDWWSIVVRNWWVIAAAAAGGSRTRRVRMAWSLIWWRAVMAADPDTATTAAASDPSERRRIVLGLSDKAEIEVDPVAAEQWIARRDPDAATTADGAVPESVPHGYTYKDGLRHGAASERQHALAVLAEHYLMDIICNPDTHMDNPVCGCSRTFLGWHPSIGAARQAWIDHVADLLGGDGDEG